MTIANALGEFLKARRGLVRPQDAGVAVYGRRRVPGLRRDELAELAGLSTPYLVRLEQGRDRRPSPQVLDALTRALRLDDDAAAHLRELARAEQEDLPRDTSDDVAPGVQQLLDGWTGAAAYVRSRRFDVLAVNALAYALSPGYRPGRNLVRDTFLDPAARDFFADWPTVAQQAVGGLRAAVGAGADDPRLGALVAELSAASEDFRALWERHEVRATRDDVKPLVHPVVGPLTVQRQVLSLPNAGGQTIIAYHAEPGTPSAATLARLAASPG
ncbi:MAG TPA: helix-turn-helix transcriptional regulator [Baekduia sp.]|nr:helix-turn-helix transcriptional regulator [Baekduia sp.]